MYQFRQILKRDTLNLFTNPMWIFYTVFFPLLMILILGFLSEGSYGIELSSYDYYGITMMIYSALNAATLAANSFMEQRIKSPNLRIVFSPVKPMYIYLSKIIATVIFTTVCYSAVGVALHFMMNVNFGGEKAIFLWILMIAVEFFASCLSVMVCCIVKSEEITNTIVSNLITLLAVVGGLFFPVDGMGKVIEVISDYTPVKWISTSLFQIVYDNNMISFLPTLGILIVLGTICIFVSHKAFRMEEYL